MKTTYTRISDYYLPNLRLSDLPDSSPLGRFGMMHKEYLRKEKPILYAALLLSERLYPLCWEVDQAAAHRLKLAGEYRQEAMEAILAELVYN